MMEKFSAYSPPKYMRWQDIQEVFGFGKNKCLALLHEAGPEYLGRVPMIKECDFYLWLDNNQDKLKRAPKRNKSE